MSMQHDDHKDATARKNAGQGGGKRRKVSHACLYCRRSHMTCDDSRPCQRCIKRDIGHLCHDEPKKPIEPTIPESVPTGAPLTGVGALDGNTNLAPLPSVPVAGLGTNATATAPTQSPFNFPLTGTNGASTWPLLFPPESGGTEFSVLSDFLESLEDQSFFNGGANLNNLTSQPPLPPQSQPASNPADPNASFGFSSTAPQPQATLQQPLLPPAFTNIAPPPPSLPTSAFAPPASSTPTSELPLSSLTQSQLNATTNDSPIQVLPPSSTTKTERFLLTAADQEDGTRDERLARVIHAKYEAGLLRPFNYVNGYARLGRWMERNVSPQSKQQILQPLTIVRPKFRAIAQSLTDIDLVFIEEAFERLLLSYDRVFSAMGIPACLWRRTGEIYKGNKEFADLVGVDVGLLKDGRLCIYELMSEESAVNYWEKYGHVAFDAAQKAVLTSCVLRYKPSPSTLSLAPPPNTINNSPIIAPTQGHQQSGRRRAKEREKEGPPQERMINCCFSFTIQRDLHGIPTLIAGNFIRH